MNHWGKNDRNHKYQDSNDSASTPRAIVFSQSVYSNVKSKYTDAIQNNNKRRFAIYLKTENDGFSEKEI